MKERMVLVVILMLFACNIMALSDDAVERVCLLRAQQRYASVHEYYRCEAEITALKREAGVQEQRESTTLTWRVVRDVGRLIPYLFLQLLLITILFLLLFHRIGAWWLVLLFGGVGLIVLVQRYERQQQWIILPRDGITLMMGPGEAYPVVSRLKMLDEGRLLANRDGWQQLHCNGVTGWMPQGADDVRC